MTDCCAIEIQEIIDLSEPMNSDSDAEFDNETLTKTVTFANVLQCLETVKTYLLQQDVNDTVFSLRCRKKALSSQESKRL
ncbi:hypothetical protein TNCV_1898651 [Trichonephila clavipes]|nr:hypothetical protein TNCV_1898651 [Trichonephila clavipes]